MMKKFILSALQDTCTVLHFKMTFPEGQSINLPKESYIQPAGGGEKAVGILVRKELGVADKI
jgi:hypothetical protein